jgi:hypothetical protein
MHIEKLFYTIGVIFAIATILYFTWEYILEFSDSVKSIMLVCLAVMFFFIGEVMRRFDI